jgi:hypothetical protein
VSERVARSRELVARGFAAASVARVMQVSRQALYRVPARRPKAAGPPAAVSDEVEQAIVEVAEANQTDGYRMVTALVRRKLGRPHDIRRHDGIVPDTKARSNDVQAPSLNLLGRLNG